MPANHICFLSSAHPPRDKRVFDKEAVYLAAAGYEVTHLCPGDGAQAGMFQGVRIETYDRPAGIRGRVLQLFRLYRKAASEDADVYHCNEVDSWMVGVALRLFRRKRCVFDVHEHYPSTFAESRFPVWLRPVVAASVRAVFLVLTPFTDRIVLAKRSVSKDFYCRADKKVLVQNFTPLSALSTADDGQIERPPEPVTMLHLGLFGKARGWPQVLAAMSQMRHREVTLKVIGDIHDGTREEFERAVESLGLANRVSIYDWMPFEEALVHLRQAHIGLVAFQPGILNHVYAMPHKMFDYMAAGMAVVLPEFAVEVAPVMTEAGCGVLIDPSSPSDIAAKVDGLADDPVSLKAMGERGQAAVKATYNWDAEAKKLIEMYDGLLES